MPNGKAHNRSGLTLFLCTVLHAFTHAYSTMLVPLYFLMVADLHLNGAKAASLIVTIYGIVYALGSYAAGVVADRADRKMMLGLGLILNAVAILLMGLTRRYEALLLLAVLGGLAGTIFHPAAMALVPAHYPKAPGTAIGMLGIGAAVGFFAGPQFAGWRAQTARWTWPAVSDWQRPCVELGAIGILFGLTFMIFAREARGAAPDDDSSNAFARRPAAPMGRPLWRRVLAVSLVLAGRDFTSVSAVSLVGIYLQKAHGLDAARTGFILGSMMLIGILVNPLSVWLSPGHRRLPVLAGIMIAGGVVIASIPFWPLSKTLPVLCVFQACQLGSYAVSDAAMLERVSPTVRGRVAGMFLSIAGTIAAVGPFIMGWWADALGPRASEPRAFAAPFALLGALLFIAAFSAPLIARLGSPDRDHAIEPLAEMAPATMGPMV